MKKVTMLVGLAALLCLQASGAILIYGANMNGPSESPPNASPGTGTSLVIIDTTANTMSVSEIFANLLANTTASHIHCCTATPLTGTAGVATQVPTFIGFPLGVTSGTYSHTFNLLDPATYNGSAGAFLANNGGTAAGAEAALLAGIAAGRAYVNIHTTQFPAGEIRGFLVPVPEPATFAITGLGLLAAFALRKRFARA